jgi:uncharacterized membrane protein HdeD (DUF308 family)
MPSLEDFCQELYEGKNEIKVPKDKVTELSPGWYISKLNLPHRGSKGSWRNGRLHAHDMGDHYSVHLDRVDPKQHSIGHMIEDAPLTLFLWTGIEGAFTSAIESGKFIEEADKKIKPMFVIGIVILGLGLIFAIEETFTLGIITFGMAIGLIVLGLVFNWNGLSKRDQEKYWYNFIIGALAIVGALFVLAFPSFVIFLLVLTLIVWTLGSGLFLLFGRGDKLLFDQGSIVPLIMGMISLSLGLLLLFVPSVGIHILLLLIGGLLTIIGLMQLYSAVSLYRHVRKLKGSKEIEPKPV